MRVSASSTVALEAESDEHVRSRIDVEVSLSRPPSVGPSGGMGAPELLGAPLHARLEGALSFLESRRAYLELRLLAPDGLPILFELPRVALERLLAAVDFEDRLHEEPHCATA